AKPLPCGSAYRPHELLLLREARARHLPVLRCRRVSGPHEGEPVRERLGGGRPGGQHRGLQRHLVRPLCSPADVHGLAWRGAPRIQVPANPGDHRHEHGTLGEPLPVQSPLRKVANRPLSRTDATDPRQARHGISHRCAGLHHLEDPRGIREPGAMPDRDPTGAVDHRAVLDVEVVGEDGRPYEYRLDADAEGPVGAVASLRATATGWSSTESTSTSRSGRSCAGPYGSSIGSSRAWRDFFAARNRFRLRSRTAYGFTRGRDSFANRSVVRPMTTASGRPSKEARSRASCPVCRRSNVPPRTTRIWRTIRSTRYKNDSGRQTAVADREEVGVQRVGG